MGDHEEVWTQLGPEPQLSVIMDYMYSTDLSTGPNPSRAASFDFLITGSNDAEPTSVRDQALSRRLERATPLHRYRITARTGFGTPLSVKGWGFQTLSSISKPTAQECISR